MAECYAVGSIPSLLFFRNDEVVERVQGVVSKSELTIKLTALSRTKHMDHGNTPSPMLRRFFPTIAVY